MNLAGALLIGYLLGAGSLVSRVEQGIGIGVRDFLGLPEECRIETRLQLVSRGSLFTGMVQEAEVNLYDVDLAGLSWPTGGGAPSTGNLRGRVGTLKVSFLRPAVGGFRLERMTFLADSVEFNLGQLALGGGLSLVSVGACQGEIVIDPQELAGYIDDGSEMLSQAELALLEGGQVRFEARLGIPHVSASVEVRGRLEIVGGTRLEIADPALHFAGLPVPGLLSREIMEQINPVFAWEEGSPVATMFSPRSVEFQEGKIVVKGQAAVPFLPSPSVGVAG